MKAGEHGPDKIYDKFTVVKSKNVRTVTMTGSFGVPTRDVKVFDLDDELTHKDEWLFVMRPETDDKAAIAALRTYARVCAPTYPELAAEIEAKIKETLEKYPDGNPALRPQKP